MNGDKSRVHRWGRLAGRLVKERETMKNGGEGDKGLWSIPMTSGERGVKMRMLPDW